MTRFTPWTRGTDSMVYRDTADGARVGRITMRNGYAIVVVRAGVITHYREFRTR